EVTIRIRGLELSAGLLPLGRDVPAPHKAPGFDLEQIREIRAKRDLEVEANRRSAVVGHVDVFMNAVSDAAEERQGECAAVHRSVFGVERRIGQMKSCGVISNG